MTINPTRKYSLNILFCLSYLLFASFKPATTTAPDTSSSGNSLKHHFVAISDSVQTSVYWYWLSDNISKQGVINDLEAMKKVGINRAFIGNEFTGPPAGKVKLFSDEWWDILHAALKAATRLNIQIGIFNSPGWSQSGGPWIKPEQAMRYLTSSQLAVKGPVALNTSLVKPEKDFQDVKVIAYPVPPDFGSDISSLKPKLSISPELPNLNYLLDGDPATAVSLINGQKYELDIAAAKPYTLRGITVYPTKATMDLRGELQVKNADGSYQTIKEFDINRSNDALNVGFKPFGPGAISFPATTSANFRVVFTCNAANGGIAELKLSSTPVVEDYIEKTEAKMWQDPFPYWNAYQWKPQAPVNDQHFIIDPAKVIDISKYMAADGTLKWNVPAGNWIIERTGMTPTGVKNSPASPEGTGLEADKMSKQHIAEHFEAFLGQIIKRIPAEDRKTWKVTVEDSYETGGQNWSDDQVEKFKTNYGYDLTPYLPVLQGKVVGSEDQSDRFLWDLRRFVADKVSYEYVAGLRDISHQNGLTTWLENYGHWGFPGEFLQYGGQSDEVGGEFWSEGNLGNIENRAASSSAHIYGKTKVSAESFTCAGGPFSRYPALMKQRADRFFTEGINNTLLHVYISQPYEDMNPGVNAWFGNEFNRKNTWFYDMDIFLKYIKRCNMMLQQGRYVADVAYFISEDAPKMTGTQDPKLPAGYSFDYINGEVIKTRLTVQNGRLTLPDGLSYGILVLPKMQTMRPELLAKIKELVSQGAVVLGPRPTKSPSLQDYGTADSQVQQMAQELWGNIDGSTVKTNNYGKGMVIDGMNLQEALSLIKIRPDVSIPNGDSVLFIHRALHDSSVYFISNQSTRSISIKPEFRLSGKSPELWNPVDGSTRDLSNYSQTASTTTVPLQLAPLESAFVIFDKNSTSVKADTSSSNYPAPAKVVEITEPWSVDFDKQMRGPAKPVIYKTLQDWTLNTNDSVKYFSGTAYYHNSFKLSKVKKDEHVYINLGMVRAIAKVKVNGIEVGGAWTAPYKMDITGALKSGKNTIEVKVVNTWMNRLIGDSMLPESERKTSTFVNTYTPKSPLESSGLLGPVTVEVVKY